MTLNDEKEMPNVYRACLETGDFPYVGEIEQSYGYPEEMAESFTKFLEHFPHLTFGSTTSLNRSTLWHISRSRIMKCPSSPDLLETLGVPEDSNQDIEEIHRDLLALTFPNEVTKLMIGGNSQLPPVTPLPPPPTPSPSPKAQKPKSMYINQQTLTQKVPP